MNLSSLKKNVTRRVLVFVLPLVLIFGAYVPSADARPHRHGGRHGYHQRHHHGYRHGNGRRYYQHRGYGNRHHQGYWRYHRGHRYWYENGGYYASPGGLRIVIGL